MSRRKQAKPRSLKRDEEWDDGSEQNVLDNSEQNGRAERIRPADEDDDEEEEELQRAFARHSDGYLQEDGPSSIQAADLENQNSLDSDALGTGSSSWHSEDGGPTSRRGGETPSSCATPTSASFPSEPEADAENGGPGDGNNPAAPYPCQFCDRTFPRLSYLKKHEQSHGDQMPYRCSWCARLFKHKRSRDRHVKLHTGDRRYRCSHCEAAFSRSDHLKIHMKTHDTQKPFQCTACSRGYNTAAALTSHMQSHKKHQGGSKLEMEFGRRSVSSHSTSSPPVPNSPSTSPKLGPTLKHPMTKLSQSATSASNTPILSSPLKLACMYCTRDSFTSMQQLQLHVHTMHQGIVSGEHLIMPSPGRLSETPSTTNREPMYERKYVEERERPTDRNDSYESSFSCGQCTMKFPSLGTLRDHLLSIHRTADGFGGALMMCPLCGIPCATAAAYAEHYVLQHCENRRMGFEEVRETRDGRESREYPEPKTNGTLKDSEGGYEPYETYEPYESYEPYDGRKEGRSRDERGTTKIPRETGPVEPADLTSKHGKASSDSYSAGTLLCGQCGAALKDFESFREHLARHLQADQRNEVLKNPCPKCDASFHEREDMLDHLTKHFLGQTSKEYCCAACKKFYPHPDLLQRHLLDAHAHHLYRCALCRDTFDSRVAIQVHFAVKHSQECRIYRCNVCSASNNENSPGNAPVEGRTLFRSEVEMANHVRSVHAPPLGDSPLPRSPASTPGVLMHPSPRCVFCGVCCTSDLELQLHLASHATSLYRCPICREGFAVEFLLERHLAHAHRTAELPSNVRNNIRALRATRSQDDSAARPPSLKRGRSPASSNNNSLNQRDNNNKRLNFGNPGGQRCELCDRGEFANDAELQAHKKLAHAPSVPPPPPPPPPPPLPPPSLPPALSSSSSTSSTSSTKLQSKSLGTTLSLTCAYCGEICRSRSELESHTRIQHASNEPGGRHKCNICDEVCPSGAILAEHKLQKHCKIQLSDTCLVCRANLSTEAQFLEHVQRHSLEGVDTQQRLDNALPHLPAGCIVCRQTLMSELECRLHARHHLRPNCGSRGSGLGSSSSPNSGQQEHSQLQKPSCCLCLRELNSEDFVSLPANRSSVTGQPLRVCKSCYVRHSQGLPILNSPYELIRSGKERWDSDRKHKSEESVVASENTVVNDASTTRCEDCGVKFELPEELEKHRNAEHEVKVSGNGPNTYTCIQCQMSFATEAKIRQHVRLEHLESSGKGFVNALRCHLCLFEASSPLQLQGHLIEHTFAGCAALSCYICQSLFTTPIGLQNHMLQQHGLGARPYDCSLCSLKFFFRVELDHHIVTFHRNASESIQSEEPIRSNLDHPQGPEEENGVKEQQLEQGVENSGNQEVTIKEEVVLPVEEEEEEEDDQEEDVNVDETVEQTMSCDVEDCEKVVADEKIADSKIDIELPTEKTDCESGN